MPVIILLDEKIRFGVQGISIPAEVKVCIRNDGEFIIDKTGFTLVVISHSMHVSVQI